MKSYLAGGVAVATLAAAAPALAQTATEAGLRGSYTMDALGNVGGGFRRDVTAVHRLDVGATVDLGQGWSATTTVSGTTGRSLSARAIGDVQGVQGVYAGGNAVWLYEIRLTRTFENGEFSVGRMSSGDAFGSPEGMEQFVNSAFSSNGGAISINDPGRLPSPASSWGARGEWRWDNGLRVSGGAFLSDPRRANADNPNDFAFDPSDGVLAFAEGSVTPREGWRAGLGVWADSARFATFAGQTRRGNQGAYAFVSGRLAGEENWRRLEGFAMLQVAPRRDRSLMPLSAFAGLSLREPFDGREDDSANIAISVGRFSRQSGLPGTETTIEANYRYALTDQIAVRPTVQYVINPGGLYRHAVVLGVHVEAGL